VLLHRKSAWDQETIDRGKESLRVIVRNQQVTKDLQAAADDERLKNAKKLEDSQRLLAVALNGLRDRPARPIGGPDVPQPPSSGTYGTGAGLYRDDSELLVRLASNASRVAEQRDTCYRLYGQAREALNQISK